MWAICSIPSGRFGSGHSKSSDIRLKEAEETGCLMGELLWMIFLNPLLTLNSLQRDLGVVPEKTGEVSPQKGTLVVPPS
jgi:hypothetical protein